MRLVAVFAAAAMLTGCDGLPSSFRTDETPIYLSMGGDRYAIPANYLVAGGGGGDGAFIVASWPEMGGRPNDGEAYKRYAQSNIRIYIGPGGRDGGYERLLRGIEAMYKGETERPRVGDMKGYTAPVRVGDAYGFDHLVRQFTPRERFDPDPGPEDLSAGTHVDIYVRNRSDGRKEAYMLCDGEPAPKGRHPQCKLRPAYPEFPGTTFSISFHRRKALHDVDKVERAVRAKFAEWKAAAVIAQKEGKFR